LACALAAPNDARMSAWDGTGKGERKGSGKIP
jgi:hypothetical protein